MNSVHLHLLLTHFPIIGTFIGIGVLLYGFFTKKNEIEKVGLVILILMAILTIPVFLTGEGAEKTIEHLPEISENLIENHEELAEKAIILMGLLGFISLFNLFSFYKKYSFTKTISILTIVISLITFGVFTQVGNLGGQIRHSEIRKDKNALNKEKKNRVFKFKEDHDD